jgi:hypothetical protein
MFGAGRACMPVGQTHRIPISIPPIRPTQAVNRIRGNVRSCVGLPTDRACIVQPFIRAACRGGGRPCAPPMMRAAVSWSLRLKESSHDRSIRNQGLIKGYWK